MSASATFTCAACGAAAASVALLSPGDAMPEMAGPAGESADAMLLGRDVLADQAWLVIVGGPVSKSVSIPRAAGRIAAALQRGDAAALFRVDRELAPFWCPTCKACYCADDYPAWPTFDDGFYDATYGICPAGHERMLDD